MQIVMKLYIIAGEKSGDIHGALLLKNLLRLMPGMEVAGLGGQGMHALCPGVEDWADEAAVIGVVEVLKVSQQIIEANRTASPNAAFGIYLTVFVLYFFACWPISLLASSPFWKGYGRTSRIALF